MTASKLKIIKIQIIEWDNNKATLLVFKDDNFLDYSYFSGHASSGTPLSITNIDRSGFLPDCTLNKKETYASILDRVEDILTQKKMCKSIVKIITRNE